MVWHKPWGLVEDVLVAAGYGRGGFEQTVDSLDFTELVDIVLAEILARCVPPRQAGAVVLELSRQDRRAVRTLAFDGTAAKVTDGAGDDAVARIRFDLADLAFALYAPSPAARTVTRQVDSLLTPAGRGVLADIVEMSRAVGPAAQVVQSVLATCSAAPVDLDELAARFGSDKWGMLHWYTPHYTRHFRELADEPVRVLELGVGGYDDPAAGGGSLRMWQRYFRRGLVYGLDIHDKTEIDEPRVRTIVGDQGDAAFLRDLGAEFGPFDVVIDDGSHVNEHVLTSFDALLPAVRDGGLYVIEDLQTSYWPGYGGQLPGGRHRTTMARLRDLLDDLHHPEFLGAGGEPSMTRACVVGLHCYRNIAFIEKGRNLEGPPPEWIPRAAL